MLSKFLKWLGTIRFIFLEAEIRELQDIELWSREDVGLASYRIPAQKLPIGGNILV